jgi:GH15 family glucan-1,4-alpha-glucosidase
VSDRGIGARLEVRHGDRVVIALAVASGEPLVFSARDEVEARLASTAEFWRRWSAGLRAGGPWQANVLRSALALKLLVFAPSGAIAAAATTSLPEVIGGVRNWDYRFSWIRDSSFVLEAFLQLGCATEAQSFFWWFMHASQLTRPDLRVFYRLDGGTRAPERHLPLAGYRGSRPVRIGNAAVDQLQLDVFGSLLDAAWVYASRGHPIDRDTGRALAEIADLVCRIWRQPDHGIWEVRSEVRQFTHSKVMCWVALDRALRLADLGHVPGRNAAHWQGEATQLRAFIEAECWSERLQSYVRSAQSEELDASLLILAVERYHDPTDPRVVHTIDAIRRALSDGPFVYRYVVPDGIDGDAEGAFLTCSFWLVEALALAGRRDEAADLMGQLVQLANDVGLYAEEIDPRSREFLGNFPQALVHLALISAAVALSETEAHA